MRLLVIAPTHEKGVWAAKQAGANILATTGYVLSNARVKVFDGEHPERVRGVSLLPGDHVVYVEGWDKNKDFAFNWSLCQRITDNIWTTEIRDVEHV